MQTTNLAARAGRWSAAHRRRAIVGWLVFVVLAVGIGGAIGTKTLETYEKGSGESGRADRVIHDAGLDDAATETVMIKAPEGRTAADPAVRDAVATLTAAAKRDEAVSVVRAPRAGDERSPLVSRDGDAALVQLQLKGAPEDAGDKVDGINAAVADVRKAHPGVEVAQSGDGTISKAYTETMESDFKKAELFSIPLTFAILFFAFGAVVAAGLPVLLAMSAVIAGIGLLAIPSQALPLEESASSVLLLIGLAVGVDYVLFYLRRERQERAAGKTNEAALEAAAATSGRAVLVSGFTVMASVAGMFAAGSVWYTSYALAMIVVVAIAMAGSVTVLPALLSKLGDRVDRGRLPFTGKRRERPAGEAGRLWGAVLDRVLKRPVVAVVVSAGLLLALAAPALDLELGESGMGSLPQDMPAVTAFERTQAEFPGGSRPAIVTVQANDVRSEPVQRAIEDLSATAAKTEGLGAPLGTDVAPGGHVARVSIPLAGSGVDERSRDALAALRERVIPSTVDGSGAKAEVTGLTAQAVDLKQNTVDRGPIVFALVLAMGFVVLMITFRSIVIPLKAILLNLLSVAAAYGVLVAVFQKGWGEELLGFESTGTIATWLPVLLFVILFGLSMDYHVFVLSRIRELFDRGEPMDRAVAEGIKGTASTVTSAAMVMVGVFSIFATLGILEMKQLGVGLAVAVLIDATVVRAVLLPASMKLLGTWNWYLPRSLRWLPRVDHGGTPEPSHA